MNAKILIVEDNANNRLLLNALLTHYGYVVIEATNGEEGLNMAREQHPDIIIMDIQMPVMDGVSAVKALKSDPGTKNIKTIAVTSYAMKGDRENFLSAGFDGYMSKPIDTRALPGLIKQYLANDG